MPTVRLKYGDIFDGASDVVVLPCSTAGSVTGFVAKALEYHAIPHPLEEMAPGAVEIMPFEGGETFAQYVAFAASVDGESSTPALIESIGRALGEFSVHNPAAREIAAPLLGTGAGGLRSDTAVAALKAGFTATADRGATLVIHVLDREAFQRLKQNRRRADECAPPEIRVFMSHTSGSDEAVEWVKHLALYLIDHGIQARLDRFHLRRGMDLPQWMCNELALADKVVIVCDEVYKKKADGRMGGVGWETMIIQGDLANQAPDSTKYQVVVREELLERGLPMYLKTKFAIHAPPSDLTLSFREDLLRELLDLSPDQHLNADEAEI